MDFNLLIKCPTFVIHHTPPPAVILGNLFLIGKVYKVLVLRRWVLLFVYIFIEQFLLEKYMKKIINKKYESVQGQI